MNFLFARCHTKFYNITKSRYKSKCQLLPEAKARRWLPAKFSQLLPETSAKMVFAMQLSSIAGLFRE
jgi:hypothetical protein